MSLSKATEVAAGCRGKRSFLSWDLANKVAKRSRRSKMHDGDILRPYRCRWCSYYHIGTSLS